ncbi:decarboxylase [Candidatus Woesearchaeota archaeon]|nr:decarboxylase [Candidatus Woesearchaeota archaeon]|tara:strand:- start:2655 stop:3689 length:1035 start_codon:yes stop_codon:yes gene_type:complete
MQKAKFILSKSKLLEQYNKVKDAADIVSYSSKTNQEVTKLLGKETGCMFSVHLVNELKHVSDKSRVIFLAQAWNQDEIKSLTDDGIRFFAVDNLPDLDELTKFLGNNNVKVKLLLRMKLKEYTIRTERYFVFGMDSEIINKKVKELRNNKNIERLGIHFHRKTQNIGEWNLKQELSNIIEEDVWGLLDFVNIGGGLPSVYANTNEDVIKTIFDKIKEFRDWLKENNIQMIIEPGRFIAAPAVKLITYIKGIYENNITVNASVYNTDLDALIVPVKLVVEGELPKGEGKPYVIKGITPCSMDMFRYRVYLKEPKVGDKLVFLNAGAYNFASDFCDLEKLKIEVVE